MVEALPANVIVGRVSLGRAPEPAVRVTIGDAIVVCLFVEHEGELADRVRASVLESAGTHAERSTVLWNKVTD